MEEDPSPLSGYHCKEGPAAAGRETQRNAMGTEWAREVLRESERGAKFLGWRVHRATAINTALLICTVIKVQSTTTLCPLSLSLW